jgi:predicted porin
MHKDKGRNALARAAVGAVLMAIGTAAQAQAQGLQVTISGQVNRAFMAADDGVDSDSFFVDNDNSGTRFRFVGNSDITPGLKAGVLWEVEFQGNDSNLVNMPGTPGGPGRSTPDGATRFGERHTAVFLNGGWGKVTLGQTDGAANGGIEVDLSGTQVANYSGAFLIGGGLAFRDGDTFGPKISQTTNHQDFESRYDVLRYDTPSFGGFKLAGSVGTKGNNDVKELALWYSSDLGALGRLAGALGWSEEDIAAGDDRTIGGSISWLHGSGFNATLARSDRDVDAQQDREFSYIKLGWKTGRHAVSVDFGRGEDQAAVGDEADFFGIGYVYTPVAWADLYAALKQHRLDRSAGDFDDINVLMVGSRLKF